MSKDRYPFWRRKKNNNMVECVYAGPEEMSGSRSPDDDPEPIMEDVYGGPEWMDKGMPEGDPEEIDAPEGAEEEKEPYPQKTPEPVPGMFRTLYGAPVLPQEETDEAPEEAKDDLPPPPPPPDPRMFMCVYAGPEYFNRGPQPSAGVYIPPEQFKEAANSRKFCANCGTPLPEKAKFCPECGVKLPENKDEQ